MMESSVLLVVGIVAFFFVFTYLIPIRLWLAAMFSGAYVGLLPLIGMRFRRIPPRLIVEPRIALISAGLELRAVPEGGSLVTCTLGGRKTDDPGQ